MMNLFRLPALAVVLAASARAADPPAIISSQPHAWFNYFGNHPLTKHWGLHLEGQYRRDALGLTWQQLLLRGGVNYYLTPRLTLTGGYGFIDTHPYGEYPVPAKFPEHRIWEQAQYKHPLVGKVTLQHRLRMEQRYLGTMQLRPNQDPIRTGWRYENRFRYMIRSDIPLTKSTDVAGFYLAAYDEAFWNFGKNVAANDFDQNRAYLALGKGLSKSFKLEAGYMHQFLQQRNGRIFESNNTMMLSLYSTFRFHK
jgi:hypothetical protein